MDQPRSADRTHLRRRLSQLVFGMLAVLLLGFLFILLVGALSGPPGPSQTLAELPAGHTQLKHLKGQRVWVSRISPAQSSALLAFSESIIQTGTGCPAAGEVCMVVAATTRRGIELRFQREVPPALDPRLPWIGGFIDPNNGAVYDLLGRAYLYQGPVRPLETLRP